MDQSIEFLQSKAWWLLTLGLAGALGFAILINGARSGYDAQTSSRQAAGCILIAVSVGIAISLSIWIFNSFGTRGGLAALFLAGAGAVILILLAIR